MTHWLADLIGHPYRDGAQDCWWFVCEVLRRKFGGDTESTPQGHRGVSQALRALGLRQIPRTSAFEDLDVIIGRDLKGQRHAGVVTLFGHRLEFIHNTRGSGVAREPVSFMLQQMTGIEVWRRSCSR